MKTPKILERASRQYQHNNCSGLVPGFDYKETIKIVNVMTKALKAQSRLLTVLSGWKVSHRNGFLML